MLERQADGRGPEEMFAAAAAAAGLTPLSKRPPNASDLDDPATTPSAHQREDVPMTRRRQRGNADTAARILDIAERLVQSRGFNGFSYADVASELGISKAGLHYHFHGKAELGEALIARYAARFVDALEQIDQRGGDALAKLDAYAGLYADVLQEKRMCLCGMLAADYDTLPKPMRDAVIRFFDDNELCLTRVLGQGQEDGSLRLGGSASEAAQAIIGGLEGALLVARPYGDMARFQTTATQLLTALASSTPAERASATGAS